MDRQFLLLLLFYLHLMKPYSIAGNNIEPYMPKRFSEMNKERLWEVVQEVATRIEQNLSMGFQYNGVTRLVVPASLYLQEQTIAAANSITKWAKRIPISRWGARKALWMDAIEIARQSGSAGGWKSFHLDQIDDLRIFDEEELENAFPKDERPTITSMLHAKFPRKWGFVRNWNHWFRTPLVEAASSRDLLK